MSEGDSADAGAAVAIAEAMEEGERAGDGRPHGIMTHLAAKFLEGTDFFVYVLVGLCFFLAALFSLVYGLGSFATDVFDFRTMPPAYRGLTATSIISLVSDLLLTLIIMEVLGTVVHHLTEKETTLRPFLSIGIISATRGILAVGARLSVSSGTGTSGEFVQDMIELGVNAAVIIALGIAMKVIGNMIDDSATAPRKRQKS